MFSRYRPVMVHLALFAAYLFQSACGFKSSNFVGIHGTGPQKIFGAVAQSAVDPIDQLLKEWIVQWESESCNTTCYHKLSESIRATLPLERLNAISKELKNRFGESHETKSLDQPITAIFPRIDEALIERTPEAALKYYSYVTTSYLSYRPIKNLVYVFAVGLQKGQLAIIGFAVNEQLQSSKDPIIKVYEFGVPW